MFTIWKSETTTTMLLLVVLLYTIVLMPLDMPLPTICMQNRIQNEKCKQPNSSLARKRGVICKKIFLFYENIGITKTRM